ncbi:MAG TPA: DUF411 domain-containing protein [Gemmatimonadaceae bacterium]|jgi:hypothetical protein|nr:DUF411 domain-containing protein [Gemmatimonadaceae bacterium]
MTSRRDWLRSSALASAALLVRSRIGRSEAPLPVVTVYKDPGCECCTHWVTHLNKNGFVVTVHDMLKMDEIKTTMNVPQALQSCHTAVVGPYVIEGHVPADLIKKALAEKAPIAGLSVPGMVTGSPGMEGGAPQRYDVIAFERSGKTRVYAKR